MEKLKPFEPFEGEVTADLRLVSRFSMTLDFTWNKKWKLESNGADGRLHEIWKSTCFEAFIKPKNQKQYWEINVNPSRAWNVYKFSSYREPSPPVEDSGWKLIEFSFEPGSLSVKFSHDLSLASRFEVGLSCIFDMMDGKKSYWALEHSQDKPDFHNAKTFILERQLNETGSGSTSR